MKKQFEAENEKAFEVGRDIENEEKKKEKLILPPSKAEVQKLAKFNETLNEINAEAEATEAKLEAKKKRLEQNANPSVEQAERQEEDFAAQQKAQVAREIAEINKPTPKPKELSHPTGDHSDRTAYDDEGYIANLDSVAPHHFHGRGY